MITTSAFGQTKNGESVTKYCISSESGISFSVIDYGCTVTELTVPDRNGVLVDVCLGYDTLAEYEENDGFLGAIVGRCANRIQNGAFELDGVRYELALNDGPNHLHGGVRGFDKYTWAAAVDGDKLILTRVSRDGEEGYPGNLDVKVTYALPRNNIMSISYEAQSDADTIVNLTNHTYYNLNGHNNGTILNHKLQVFADEITENDAFCLPTGVISSVHGSPFDFLYPKAIDEDIGKGHIQLEFGRGYDHNWVLSDRTGLKKAARLLSPQSGITLDIETTTPGIQVYTANTLSERSGKGRARYARHSGICLETQFFPNALACSGFPSPVLQKGEIYKSATNYCFSTWCGNGD